jgi:hypothetical protein
MNIKNIKTIKIEMAYIAQKSIQRKKVTRTINPIKVRIGC